ncbi:hypothetical protein HDV04_002775 [Boothiomyces sp. JEL0838]|nr:hypothetical protein HDV04_002775 [Boothiomyces sp. JEL0838]
MDWERIAVFLLENKHEVCQAGAALFFTTTFTTLIRTIILDRYRRQGYAEIGESMAVFGNTILEYMIVGASLFQSVAGLTCLFIAVYEQKGDFSIIYSGLFAASWVLQAILVYLELHPNSNAPRYFILPYVLAITVQGFCCYALFEESTYSYANLVLLGLNFTLFLLHINNPTRNAKELSEVKEDGRSVSPEDLASPLSLLTFSWVQPLLDIGNRKHLDAEDLPHLAHKDQMDNIIKRWRQFRNPKNSVIWDSVLFTKSFAFYQVNVAVISTVLDFAKPFFLNQLLSWIQYKQPGESLMNGVWLLIGLFVCSIIRETLYAQIFLNARHWGIQLRAVLVYEIFKKSLRRVAGSTMDDGEGGKNQKASQGKIVSLMSSDTNQIRWFITDIHYPLVDLPITIIMSISGLLYLMGTPALAGLAIIIISGPVSGWTLNNLYKIVKIMRTFVDRRIQLTNEALQGIRIIKYMAWEPKFIKRIYQAREDELKARLKLLMSNLLLIVVSWGASILVIFTSFFFYTVVAGKQLDAATAFTSISLLSIVSGALSSISYQVSSILNIRVTMTRISNFLKEEELEKFSDDHVNLDSDAWIGFKNGEFTYRVSGSTSTEQSTSGESAFTLRNINIEFPRNKLTSVIGATGSGKTSLLVTLLGELKTVNGHYSISESHLIPDSEREKSDIAYVPQTAWLMNATIRDNILYGEDYDEERYYKVVKACALLRDFQTLEGGDMTEIGEKGVNLSGGQKQRVSLARAAYSYAPIVLLDDPLSAVDAPTARHLLYNCILDLFQGRTIILVTHAINLVIPKSDYVVVMKNGSVFAQGTPDEINDNAEVTEVVSKDLAASIITDGETEVAVESDDIPLKSQVVESHKEKKATGSVKFETYLSYIAACGGAIFLAAILVSFSVQTAADYLSNWWIQVWTDSLKIPVINATALAAIPTVVKQTFSVQSFEQDPSFDFKSDERQYSIFKANTFGDEEENSNNLFYISVYGAISFVELFSLLLKYAIQFFGGIAASRMMHSKLLNSVLGSPMRFFETTPVGRIINRFSNDLSDIDQTVMFSVVSFISTLLGAIARIGMVSFVTPPFALSFFIVYFYYRVAKVYLQTSRELKRIESVSGSPIYAQFGETLNGASTIRAFGAEKKSIREIQRKVDSNHRAFFYLFATNRWLMFRTSVLSGIIVFCAGLSLILTNVSAGWAGVAFIFAGEITRMISNTIMTHASLEMAMNAVERVDEYSKLPQEPSESPTGYIAPPDWPSQGAIEVSNLSVQYAPDLPIVLKNLTFNIAPKEKLGIVGRTGAGKSTLSLAFFRILPYSEGTIYIDGIDVSKLGTHDLRSNLTIIPQDPVLFEGTLRSNLDPLDEHSDEAIWDALKHTHVLESLQTAEDAKEGEVATISLDSEVTENGSNYSQGQRQLLCMARALLRSSKFIFMDEATASVDPETDSKIQQTIRNEFDATILTVAHRLKTIIDYDRVLVMDNGTVAEIGTPYELLQTDGIFYNMCQESGDYDHLVEVATQVHLMTSFQGVQMYLLQDELYGEGCTWEKNEHTFQAFNSNVDVCGHVCQTNFNCTHFSWIARANQCQLKGGDLKFNQDQIIQSRDQDDFCGFFLSKYNYRLDEFYFVNLEKPKISYSYYPIITTSDAIPKRKDVLKVLLEMDENLLK